MLSEDEAGAYVGCQAWLRDMVRCGWIKGVQRGKIKRYDVEDLDVCCDRLEADEWPE
jgi:hypothetical protein